MKWTTALKTLEQVGERCAHVAALPPGIIALQVEEAWVFGPLLGPVQEEVGDLDGVRVALVTDAAALDLAWGTRPTGAGQWLAASGLEKRPVQLVLRPGDGPVGNHAVDRPVRFWSREDGLDHDVLRALRAGDGEHLRPQSPTAEEAARQLDADLAVSLAAVRATGADYDAHRWAAGDPVKRADALAAAVRGYAELLTARDAAAHEAAAHEAAGGGAAGGGAAGDTVGA